jgi:hypothetical protein
MQIIAINDQEDNTARRWKGQDLVKDWLEKLTTKGTGCKVPVMLNTLKFKALGI